MLARELSDIVFGYGKHGILMPIKPNFDGSGTDESPVLTVGGYFASDQICSDIETEWNSALIDAGMTEADGTVGVFHLATFGGPWCKYGTGAWSIEKRVELIKHLARIVNRSGNHIVSFSVEKSQYQDFVDNTANKPVWGPCFSGCALMAFSFTELTLDQQHLASENVAYAFEKGDRQHELNHAFMEYDANQPGWDNLRSLTFMPKKAALLQAADLIAGKIQEVLMRANDAIHSLDNGLMLTPLNRFKRYYSHDGTTEEIMRHSAMHDCYVANKRHFHTPAHRYLLMIPCRGKFCSREQE